MGKKQVITIRIDSELVEKAHLLGLNMSQIARNAIKEAIEKMEAY